MTGNSRLRPTRRTATDVVERLQAYDAGRDPPLVARKYAAMTRDAFVFFRGSCGLFYDRLATRIGSSAGRTLFGHAPRAWTTGDLHLENFGSFRGDNGLAYFDLNDFDEAALAPAPWELVRFIASMYVAFGVLGVKEREWDGLVRCAAGMYASALREGTARWIERATAVGEVRRLLKQVKSRKRRALVDARTESRSGRTRLRIDGRRTLPVSRGACRAVIDALRAVAEGHGWGDSFEVLDVARRVAGTGSLGLHRYIVLARGLGRRQRRALLDLKAARPSVLAAAVRSVGVTQPRWPSEAARVVGVQRRCDAAAPALLHAIGFGRQSYIVRELQPTEDRLDLARSSPRTRRLESVLVSMARVVAWSHLRSGGRQGSATADEWIRWGEAGAGGAEMLEMARQAAGDAERDWATFLKAYERGVLGVPVPRGTRVATLRVRVQG